MKRFFQATLACVVLAISAFGAKPLATVTSAEPFALNGHSMNAPGVTSFPVILGDTVSTSKSSAVLSFAEGSTIKLGANSAVRIDGNEEKPKVVLLAGDLDFKLAAGTKISVTNLDSDKTTSAGHSSDTPPVATGAAPTNAHAGLLTNPKFLIPAAGIGAAGLTTGLLTLPPVSRHL
jgi:hypothetical protein